MDQGDPGDKEMASSTSVSDEYKSTFNQPMPQLDTVDTAMPELDTSMPEYDMRGKRKLQDGLQGSEMPQEDSFHGDGGEEQLACLTRVCIYKATFNEPDGTGLAISGMDSSFDTALPELDTSMPEYDMRGKRKLQDGLQGSEMPHEDSLRAKRGRTKDGDDMVAEANVVARVAPPLHILGIDLLGEILGWLSAEDFARACTASKYLLAISKMPSLRRQLRINHSSRRRTGPFLGVVVQTGAQIYLWSPNLSSPLKSAAVALAEILQTESSTRINFTLRDSRDGRLLVSTDHLGTQFLVCTPFEEDRCHCLPLCPALTPNAEDLICAAFLPHEATRDYTVIVIAVKIADRSVACLKKFVSKDEAWSCSEVQCAFQFPATAKLCASTVHSNGHLIILNPAVGMITVNIQNLMMSVIPLPSLGSVTRRQLICQNRQGSLCFATARVVAGLPGRCKKTIIFIYVFDWESKLWILKHQWPVPKSMPCSSFLGFAAGHCAIIVGTGWESLYLLTIDDGRFSHEMSETGARNAVLAYEIEYPSTSWLSFSK